MSVRSLKHTIIFAGTIVAVSIAIAIFLVATYTSSGSSTLVATKKHSSYSSDRTVYGIDSQPNLVGQHVKYVYGGIVSHHLLASLDIAKFFIEFEDQQIDRIILVGPNHFYPESYPAVSTVYDYETPFGDVPVDVEFIKELQAERLVNIDQAVVETEHAVSSLVPYIAAYSPDTKIVPLIINRNAPKSYINELSQYLISRKTEKTVLITSVDFSHHLYSNASFLHDVRSVAAITSFDYENIWNLEIDSPQSVHVLLRFLESGEAKELHFWQQNAAQIFSDPDIEDVTSYVFAHAVKGDALDNSGTNVLFFGDAILGRSVATDITNNKDLFKAIRGPEGNFLKGFDAIAVNLEGSIEADECGIEHDELVIQRDHLEILSKENITHVGIANNHFERCEMSPEERQGIFEGARLTPLVTGDVVEISGTNNKVGIVSIYAAPIPNDITNIVDQVKNIVKVEDFDRIVVNIHWGIEYSTKQTEKQTELAHALVEAGADLIIGHHPHVVQPVEVYKEGVIFYSLGNFISDQVGTLTQSGLSTGVFFGDGEMFVILFPFQQVDGIPTGVSQSEARRVCEQVVASPEKHTYSHPCVLKINASR